MVYVVHVGDPTPASGLRGQATSLRPSAATDSEQKEVADTAVPPTLLVEQDSAKHVAAAAAGSVGENPRLATQQLELSMEVGRPQGAKAAEQAEAAEVAAGVAGLSLSDAPTLADAAVISTAAPVTVRAVEFGDDLWQMVVNAHSRVVTTTVPDVDDETTDASGLTYRVGKYRIVRTKYQIDTAALRVWLWPDDAGIPFSHSVTCPTTAFCRAGRPEHHVALTSRRRLDFATTVIVEASDGRVLLTQRSMRLKIFPGFWVCAGGHIEDGEDIIAAGIREVLEETGLVAHADATTTLCMWESVFPIRLDIGPMQRQHLVVFLHARVAAGQQLRIQPAEVATVVWLSKHQVRQVVGLEDMVETHVPGVAPVVESADGIPGAWDAVATRTEPVTVDLLQLRDNIAEGTRFGLTLWAARA